MSSSNAISDAEASPFSVLWIVRHGDREDDSLGSRAEWATNAISRGAHSRDPPLSVLGHQQATETAQWLLKAGVKPDQLLVSPYIRTLQTAVPFAKTFGLSVCIEEGLAEVRHMPGTLPTPVQRRTEITAVDAAYNGLIDVLATPDCTAADPFDGHSPRASESWPQGYLRRVLRFAPLLEEAVAGRRTVCVTHAAAVALIAALLRSADVGKLSFGAFAPCGVWCLEQAVKKGPWRIAARGDVNDHLSNAGSTPPWGFDDAKAAAWSHLAAPVVLAAPCIEEGSLLASRPPDARAEVDDHAATKA